MKMKMKKKITQMVAKILALSLILSIITIPTMQAETQELTKIQALTDIDGHWAEKYIIPLYEQGVITGDHGRYEPNKTMTKAEYATLLVKVMGYDYSSPKQSQLNDVLGHWAEKYIETLIEQDITKDYHNNWSYAPNSKITRKDMFSFMVRALKLETSDKENPYEDLEVNDRGYDQTEQQILKATELGLIKGYERLNKKYLDLKETATKAEVATIILRIQEYIKDPKAFEDKYNSEEQKALEDKEKLEIEMKTNPNYGNKNVVFGEAAVAKKAELKEKLWSVAENFKDPEGGYKVMTIPDPGYWVEPVFEVGKSTSIVGPGQGQKIEVGIELRTLNMIDIPKGYAFRASIKEYPELLSKQYLNGIYGLFQVERHIWSVCNGTGGNGDPNGSINAFVRYNPLFPQGIATPYPKKGELITFVVEIKNAKEAHSYEIKAIYE